MKGRRPKPTSWRVIEGNRGRRPLNRNEPRPTPTMPTVPAHLSDAARTEWDRLAPQLHALGLLTELDRAMFAVVCVAIADVAEAEQRIAQFGKFMKGSRGQPIRSPYVRIRDDALAILHRFAIEFGLTPASRGRISVPTLRPQPTDPASKYTS
jgi:P27 family predicted phage terminase small subunit